MPEPYELTASEAAAAIAAGRLAPPDLVDSLLERIEALEPAVHAWARIDVEGVRSAARQCAAELAEGRRRGPLHGVPLGFKDIYYTAGLGTEAGSPLLAGFVPDRDAETVARLRAAGAIVLGKTETTQFASGDAAPTRNPYNLAHTPGGSSSGSAAAVAARMVPAALGSQTAGSVLRPAAFCGIAGFKPSAGRFSLQGIIPFAWSLDHPGVLARSVADLRLFFTLLDEYGGSAPEPAEIAAPKLGLLRGAFLDRAEPEALANLEHVARQLASAGANVREVRLPDDFDLALEVHQIIMVTEAAAYHAAAHAARPRAYRRRLKTAIEVGELIPAVAYLQAQRLRAELTEAAGGLFAGVDCLLMPAATGPAPAGIESTGDPAFNAPWSLFGMPAIALPSGLSRSGLPLGLQIIGPALADVRLLSAAAWCERFIAPLPAPVSARLRSGGGE